MADITREKAIDTLKRLKTTHMGDFGWDLTGAEAFAFAISDMDRVEQLEAENKRLKEGIANVKAEIKKYTVVDICKVSHVLQIINKYLGE